MITRYCSRLHSNTPKKNRWRAHFPSFSWPGSSNISIFQVEVSCCQWADPSASSLQHDGADLGQWAGIHSPGSCWPVQVQVGPWYSHGAQDPIYRYIITLILLSCELISDMTVQNVGQLRGSKLVRTCINLSTPRMEWVPTGGKQLTLGTMRLISSQWAQCRDTNSITKLDITVKWSGGPPQGWDVVLSFTGQSNIL